jgi:hypothetical protein
MQSQFNQESEKNKLTKNVNQTQRLIYIHSQLALNHECFIEIPIDTNDKTIIDINENTKFTNIHKNELIFLFTPFHI